MVGTFTLDIDVGSAAMAEVEDIVAALREVADRFGDGMEQDGKIIDANGNTVGRFAYVDDEAAAGRGKDGAA
jgi:hypothetical protein